VLAISQLMVVLDATIVNVALERIQVALSFTSQSDLQWIVTGYALTFGGFLLLGGKLADRLGRRRVFIAGAVLFAVASFLGGIAENQGAAHRRPRAAGPRAAPSCPPAALSLLTVVFAEGKERDRALGIWAAITAGGAALGLILGGVLTEYLDWRWVFYVNVPIAVLAVVGALAYVPESRDESARGFDVAGAVTVTGGLMALVYGLVKVNDDDLSTGTKTGLFVLAAVLLTAFTVLQRRVASPLLPFRLFHNRSVLGADVASLFIGAGIFGIFFFLTLWMQVLNGYSPIRAGLAFLPMTLLIGVGAGHQRQTARAASARVPLLLVGPLLAAAGPAAPGPATGAGQLLRRRRAAPRSRWSRSAWGWPSSRSPARPSPGVPQEDAGIASALLNAGQQVGGALGLAVLTAVSTARTQDLLPEGVDGLEALQPQPGATAAPGPGLHRPGLRRREQRLGAGLRRRQRVPARRGPGRGLAGAGEQGGRRQGAQGGRRGRLTSAARDAGPHLLDQAPDDGAHVVAGGGGHGALPLVAGAAPRDVGDRPQLVLALQAAGDR
jgi:MFS family permease